MALELFRVDTPSGPRYVKHLQTKRTNVQLQPVNLPHLVPMSDTKPFWVTLLQFRRGQRKGTITMMTVVPCRCGDGYMDVRIANQQTRLFCRLCDAVIDA